MSTNKELNITKRYDLAKPTEVVIMAGKLKNFIVGQKLYTDIKGKNYAYVDGWQFAGFLTGLNAIIKKTINLSTDKEMKWKAVAELYLGDKCVGRGDALCSNKEEKKKSFDEYAILSMAQTRAIGKAFRNKLGWVMKLAGYESTPSEEMTKVGQTPAEPIKTSPTGKQGAITQQELPALSNSVAREKLFALAREYGAVAGKEPKLIGSVLKMKINWAKCTEKNLQIIYSKFLAAMTK